MDSIKNLYKKLRWINSDIENAKKGKYTVLCLKAWRDGVMFGYVAMFDPAEVSIEKIKTQAVIRFKGKCELEMVTKVEHVSYEYAQVMTQRADLFVWGERNFCFDSEMLYCDLFLSDIFRTASVNFASQLDTKVNGTLLSSLRHNSSIVERLSLHASNIMSARKKIDKQVETIENKMKGILAEVESECGNINDEESFESFGREKGIGYVNTLNALNAMKEELQELKDEMLDSECKVRDAICRKNYEYALSVARHTLYQKEGSCPKIDSEEASEIDLFGVGLSTDEYFKSIRS